MVAKVKPHSLVVSASALLVLYACGVGNLGNGVPTFPVVLDTGATFCNSLMESI